MVKLTECLDILRASNWVSLRYITADLKQGTGGKIMELPKCRLLKHDSESEKPNATSVERSALRSKAQNHHANFTINVELPNKQIRKVHPILITHINNEPLI